MEYGDCVEGSVKDIALEEYGIYTDKKKQMELKETTSDITTCL